MSGKSLHIFISHKAEDSEAVRGLKEILQTFSAGKFGVYISEDINPGTSWVAWIQKHLIGSQMLLLLITDLHSGHSKGQLPVICIHDPGISPPAPLQHLQTLQAAPDKVKARLQKLFGDPGYFGAPNGSFAKNEKELERQASRICDLMVQGDGHGWRFPMRFEIALEWRTQMTSTTIPGDATLTADNLTLPVFGLNDRGSAWTWQETLDEWRVQVAALDRGTVDDRWVRGLGRALLKAKGNHAVEQVQTSLRSCSDGRLYLPVLYRVDKRGRQGPIRFGVFLLGAGRGSEIPAEVDSLLSAIVLATRFRFEVLERFIPKLKEVRSPQTRESYCEHVGFAIRALEEKADERRLGKASTLARYFEDQDEKDRLEEIYHAWRTRAEEIFDAVLKNDAKSLWRELKKVEPLNVEFLKLVSARHNATMQDLR
jgi:hypothetical protein